MELKITGEPKEIAELVRQIQARQDSEIVKIPVIQMRDEKPVKSDYEERKRAFRATKEMTDDELRELSIELSEKRTD